MKSYAFPCWLVELATCDTTGLIDGFQNNLITRCACIRGVGEKKQMTKTQKIFFMVISSEALKEPESQKQKDFHYLKKEASLLVQSAELAPVSWSEPALR